MNPLYVIGAIAACCFGAKGISGIRNSIEQENERRNTPCYFDENISFTEFERAAREATKRIKRIEDVSVSGPVIYCTVRSQSGISTWHFSVDFNDWGQITGSYWLRSDNHDSQMPENVAKEIQRLVSKCIADSEARKRTAQSDETLNNGSFTFTCMDCGKRLSVPNIDAKLRATCPICGSEYVVE